MVQKKEISKGVVETHSTLLKRDWKKFLQKKIDFFEKMKKKDSE
jgi:hypothetical protein